MPPFLLPKSSTPHRVAAIALYRALLSRCTSAPLPDEDRSSLRNAIRQKFRRNRKIASARQLGLTFRAGYEILDHLDAASAGDSSSASFLTSVISNLSPGLRRPPPPRRPPPEQPLKKELACLPPEKAVLQVRPYQVVSGPRHVPILCSANGIPFLRLKKPQPASLSRILRQKLDTRNLLFARKVLLSNYWMPIAAQEDKWDEILQQELGFQDDPEAEEKTWISVFERAYHDNTKQHDMQLKRDRAIAQRMLEIVDKETELALKEGQKIIRGRKHRPLKIIS